MTTGKDIGELRERVQILSPTTTVGGNGERIETWGEYATRWMKVEPLSGSESTIDDMALSIVRAKFTARYDENIGEKCRLIWNGQTWNIRAIEFDEAQMFIMLTCDSNTLQGVTATDYGNYYLTNSLKVRTVTGTYTIAVDGTRINQATGLTPSTAGAGYICVGTFTKPLETTLYYLIVSDGTNWMTTQLTVKN